MPCNLRGYFDIARFCEGSQASERIVSALLGSLGLHKILVNSAISVQQQQYLPILHSVCNVLLREAVFLNFGYSAVIIPIAGSLILEYGDVSTPPTPPSHRKVEEIAKEHHLARLGSVSAGAK